MKKQDSYTRVTLRLPTDLRDNAMSVAQREERSLNYIVVRALREYLRHDSASEAKQPA